MANWLAHFCGGLHFRFLTLILGVVTALLVVQLTVETVRETNQSTLTRYNQAINLTSIVSKSIETQIHGVIPANVDHILSTIQDNENVQHASVINAEKTLILDGNPETPNRLKFHSNPLQIKALSSGEREVGENQARIEIAEPLKAQGKVVGALLIQFGKPGFFETFGPILQSKMTGLLPILFVGLLAASLLVTQITKPIRKLVDGAKIFSDGDLNHRVEVEGAREIRVLGDAFTHMVERLKENIEQTHELAYVDRVTQLPNREFFRKELTRSINRALRSNSSGALLFVDLDGFKKVNDTMGHDQGDQLLLAFANRITQVLRKEDLVGIDINSLSIDEADDEDESESKSKQVLARLGGDEFTILLSEIREETDAASVARRIINAVNQPFDVDGSSITIGASIGIATFPRDGSDYQNVLKSADMAMYQAKEEGKGTYRYYSQELNDRASNRMEIESDLRVALSKGDQLELHYQPKIDCQTGEAKGAEALVRWKHPHKGMVPPLDFIGIAEETGLILPLGKWILEEACRNIHEFKELGLDISVAVNISTPQFEHPDFVKLVQSIVETSRIESARLELEITESLAMSDPDKALDHITQLKEGGIKIAIDDFGTGYSNLSQLSRMPFDVFKIDRSFVDGVCLPDGENDRIIVKTILAMAKSMNYRTVAEGVESQDQYQFLKDNDCDYVQGYFFARPMPKQDFLQWMQAFGKAKPKRKVARGSRRAKKVA